MLVSSSKKMKTALWWHMVAVRRSLRLKHNPTKTEASHDMWMNLLLMTVGKISDAQILAPFPSLRLYHSFGTYMLIHFQLRSPDPFISRFHGIPSRHWNKSGQLPWYFFHFCPNKWKTMAIARINQKIRAIAVIIFWLSLHMSSDYVQKCRFWFLPWFFSWQNLKGSWFGRSHPWEPSKV